MTVPTPLLKTRLRIEQARESYRYKTWYKYRHQAGTAQVHAERSKWWVLYSDARAKRLSLEREVNSRADSEDAQTVSGYGAQFIAHFEGFSSTIYHDMVGVATVGYGHTENVHPGAVWVKGQRTPGRLTQAEGLELLHNDLNQNYAPAIRELHAKLDSNQFDALTSFVYNVGVGGVSSSTHVGHDLRAGQLRAAANALLEWDRAGGNVVQGLLVRREAERDLFLR
jgi:lysozyme